MKIAVTIARLLLGLIFFVFGLNGWLQFMPAPEIAGKAGEFIGALVSSGYFHVIIVIKVVGGLALLSGRYVPLGLTLLGPVIVNILCFHVFLAPEGLITALVVSVLEVFLIWSYRTHFAAVFAAKAMPAGS